MNKKQATRIKRHIKIRAKISGTKTAPRLCVFRSNKHIYAQLIDDSSKKIICAANDTDIKGKKTEKAAEVGKAIAKLAKEKKITKAVFDRGGFKYHGRIKSLADGAREEGLKF